LLRAAYRDQRVDTEHGRDVGRVGMRVQHRQHGAPRMSDQDDAMAAERAREMRDHSPQIVEMSRHRQPTRVGGGIE
jgi:hypothetical protein